MARPKTVPSDPLIAALIAKLPTAGNDFPIDKQMAWLNLMAMTFGVVYGGDAAARLTAKTPEVTNTAAAKFGPARASNPPPPKPTYPFLIDLLGYARNAKGQRILPSEATDALHDLRGIDGDMKTIVWADDSTGLNGRDLTIVAA